MALLLAFSTRTPSVFMPRSSRYAAWGSAEDKREGVRNRGVGGDGQGVQNRSVGTREEWGEVCSSAEWQQRTDDPAEDVLERPDGADELGGAGDGAGEDVVVAGEVLGGGVDDEIRPERKGLLVEGGGEGRVDRDDGPLGVAELRDAANIDAAEVWVRGGLGEEERDFMLLEGLLRGGHGRGKGGGSAGGKR